MKIGFIGLGIMGRPMALNLKNAGHELIVPERSSLTDEIRAAAKVVATPKAVAAESEVLILMVPDTPDVEAVLFGENGAAEGLRKGRAGDRHVLDQPDRDQGLCQANQRQGLRLPRRAGFRRRGRRQAGTLTIMVGGPDAAFARAKPLFEVMGKNITHVGSGTRRRPDLQGGEPDHRRVEYPGGVGGAGVRLEGRGRSGQGAPGADGRASRRRASWKCTPNACSTARSTPASRSSCIRRT